MPLGPGKYDDLCTEVREKTNANGVVLIVLGGDAGGGFSCQLETEAMLKLPMMLRLMANDIERSMPGEMRAISALMQTPPTNPQ